MRAEFSRFGATLAWVGVALALVVVAFGAYVRLSHAGLGCPDWPVCYGQITWPEADHEVASANTAFPQRPVETGKAAKEQIHRFLAASLGVITLGLALVAAGSGRRRWVVGALAAVAAGGTMTYILGARALSGWISVVAVAGPLIAAVAWRRDPRAAHGAAQLGLIIFQAMLGMWTVTLLLKPIIVTAHLLGGLLTLASLLWFALRESAASRVGSGVRPALWAFGAALALQVFLGGWTSSNYAALACPDFPTCQGQWWPQTDFGEAFVLWRGVGVDYEGGILDGPARAAIHLSHRIVALVVLGLAAWLLARLWRVKERTMAVGLLILLAVQVFLGIGNVVAGLPLAAAVAHNAGAAALTLWLTLALYRYRTRV